MFEKDFDKKIRFKFYWKKNIFFDNRNMFKKKLFKKMFVFNTPNLTRN